MKVKIGFLNRPYNSGIPNGLRYFVLTINDIDVEATLKSAQQVLAEEANLSPTLRSLLTVLILLVQIMAGIVYNPFRTELRTQFKSHF